MRRYRGKDGGARLWSEDREIEEIMAAEPQRAALFPTSEAAWEGSFRYLGWVSNDPGAGSPSLAQ
jgi:hypothetical protein